MIFHDSQDDLTSRFSEDATQGSHGIVPHPRILTNDVKNMQVHVFYVVPRGP
jgi:hypothetical protein